MLELIAELSEDAVLKLSGAGEGEYPMEFQMESCESSYDWLAKVSSNT
jgi:hypothetical protein